MKESPNPGSSAAYELGCICPRMDNCNGKFAPWPPDGWWIVAGCPVHSNEVAGATERSEETTDGN